MNGCVAGTESVNYRETSVWREPKAGKIGKAGVLHIRKSEKIRETRVWRIPKSGKIRETGVWRIANRGKYGNPVYRVNIRQKIAGRPVFGEYGNQGNSGELVVRCNVNIEKHVNLYTSKCVHNIVSVHRSVHVDQP